MPKRSKMSLFNFILVVCLIWIIVTVGDNLLKNSRKTRNSYLTFLEEKGLYSSFGYLRIYTVKLNNVFSRVEKWPPKLLHYWFTLGVYVGITVMFSSIFLLSYNLIGYFRTVSSEEHVLVPVVPGVNLPWNQIAYYFIVLLILAVLHESGHAIAAVSEQVRLNGFAVFLCLLYPGAYVDLHSDHLRLISSKRQLKIYCAGSWHNVVIALAALGALYCQPFLLHPFYNIGRGVVVTSLSENSVLKGKIFPGTRIIGINSCPVSNTQEWVECISNSVKEPQWGYCASVFMLELQPSIQPSDTWFEDGIRDCCDKALAKTHVCFYVAQIPTTEPPENAKVKQVGEVEKDAAKVTEEYKCLAARPVTAGHPCHGPRDCVSTPTQTCIFPTVDNTTKLIRIQHSHDVDALFFGDPRILFMTVEVSDYEPRTFLFWLQFPRILETFLVYCISLSGALALLNMIPTFALDGQWTFMAFVDEYLQCFIQSKEAKNKLFTTVFTLCLLLLLSNIIMAFFTLL